MRIGQEDVPLLPVDAVFSNPCRQMENTAYVNLQAR